MGGKKCTRFTSLVMSQRAYIYLSQVSGTLRKVVDLHLIQSHTIFCPLPKHGTNATTTKKHQFEQRPFHYVVTDQHKTKSRYNLMGALLNQQAHKRLWILPYTWEGPTILPP